MTVYRWQQVDAKLKLDTDITFAPFNLDLLEISPYEFSSEYGRSIVKYLRKVLPEGEVPQNLFEHFPSDIKVFMVAPKIMCFIENLSFRLFLECVRCKKRQNRCARSAAGRRSQLYESSPAGTLVDGSPRA